MSYRSRIYNHRNAQTPEGDKKKKPFFSSKRGAGAGGEKRKFFQGGPSQADSAPRVQRLATSQIDEGVGTNEERMARNKGDKFRQEHAANGKGGGAQGVKTISGDNQPRIQRQHAIEPTNPDAVQPELTKEQVNIAIRYNNERYGEASIKLIQNVVGGPSNGIMGEETVRRIAFYQAQYHLNVDGMAGPTTFGQLTDEMGAAGASTKDCITYFYVYVRDDISARPRPGNLADLLGRFDVEIRFDPHCDCSRLEFRQYISGEATRNGTNINDWFTRLPGGTLPHIGGWVWDGDTTEAGGMHYGIRDSAGKDDPLDHYYDSDGTTVNQKHGCVYKSFDIPGLNDATADKDDHYELDIRYLGEIRLDGKPIEKKYWAVRGNFTIPG